MSNQVEPKKIRNFKEELKECDRQLELIKTKYNFQKSDYSERLKEASSVGKMAEERSDIIKETLRKYKEDCENEKDILKGKLNKVVKDSGEINTLLTNENNTLRSDYKLDNMQMSDLREENIKLRQMITTNDEKIKKNKDNEEKEKEIKLIKKETVKEIKDINENYDKVIKDQPNTITGDNIVKQLEKDRIDKLANISTRAREDTKNIDSDKTIIVNRELRKGADGQDQIIVNVYNIGGGGGGGDGRPYQPYQPPSNPVFNRVSRFNEVRPIVPLNKSISKENRDAANAGVAKPVVIRPDITKGLNQTKQEIIDSQYTIKMSDDELINFITENKLIEDFDDIIEPGDVKRALDEFRFKNKPRIIIDTDKAAQTARKRTKSALESIFSKPRMPPPI